MKVKGKLTALMVCALAVSQLGWVGLQDGEDARIARRPRVDRDGVAELYQSAPGLAFRLGADDPNREPHLTLDNDLRMRPGWDGPVRYWTAKTYSFEYASGGQGKTARVHVNPSGLTQRETWRTSPDYLSDPLDFGDQELTAYVRVRGLHDPQRAAITLKVRGGEHTQRDPARASCTMMTFATRHGAAVSRFGKELEHPRHDYVSLPLLYPAALEEGRWVGLKLVSLIDPADSEAVLYQLYVDDQPFDTQGRPRNRFRLLSEYVDRAGQSTGEYDRVVDWGGSVSTLRVDGVDAVDVAILSVRPIEEGRRVCVAERNACR